MTKPITYADSGVNIELGDDVSKILYNAAKQTWVNRKGKLGEFYNIGSNKNHNNLEITKKLLSIASKHIVIGKNVKINYIKDRPGHDKRYALNSSKINKNLSWKSLTTISDGLEKTFLWYLNNQNYFNSLKKNQIIKRLGKL